MTPLDSLSGQRLDAAIVGGGIMGCTTALHLARGGMSNIAVFERDGLCMRASGVNAGTLSIQIKRAALIPYALRGWEMWRDATQWLGDVGFGQRGGVTLAFTEDEAAMLEQRMAARVEQGATIEMVGANRARELEPGLSDKVLAASYCPLDGYSNSSITGEAFRRALGSEGVAVWENTDVAAISRYASGYRIETSAGSVTANRLILAGGAWLGDILARDFGLSIEIIRRINQVSVTERMRPIVHRIVGVATGLLTLKQSNNGTILIGGGWQGHHNEALGGTQLNPEHIIGNLRLAHFAIPELEQARVVRSWAGQEGSTPDFMPVVGDLPGYDDAFIIGLVRGGYTIGPYMGRLLAQHILGQEPEMPLFDPSRVVHRTAAAEGAAQD